MVVVVQRVTEASVSVGGKISGQIGKGLVALLGVSKEDVERDVDFVARKTVNLRIFNDMNGKMNRCLLEEKGDLLLVSQFTLLGNCLKGKHPSFEEAAPLEKAKTGVNHGSWLPL